MFALPAAASAVAAAAPAAAASAAASAGIGATLTSIAGNVLMNVAISAAMSVFQPQVGVAGRTFEWTLDPDGPIPFAAGRIGVPGSAIYRKTFGPDLMYYGIPSVLSGAGPIDGFEGFMADDETVTFDGSGKAVSSQYAGELWYKTKQGTQPDTAITSPTGLKNGATLPGWTSAHKLSGKACYMIVMGENSKGTAFPTGEIKPLITFRGLLVYDPRKDSTYPGGSGEHRLSNPLTWEYSANPILWALKWTLGLWEGPNGKGAPQVDYQVGGIGAKLSGIDVPAFVAAANVADANGWTCAAYPTTDDDKHQVLTGFLQAGGAIYAQRAGKISCIQRAAPRTSIVTVSAYDTAGPLEIDTAASRIDRINTLRPRFWSEPHRWQMTALDQEVTAQAYRNEDGGVRPAGIDYPYVTDAVQASQLAALQIANTREGIAGVIPLKPHLQRIRPGDAFTITEAGFVLNGLKCLCLNTDYDPATGVVRVSFVSETDAKYPFALGQDPTPPEPQVLTPVDPRFVSPPEAGDWTVTVPGPAPDGSQLPNIDLTGLVSNDTADALLISWRAVASGENPNTQPLYLDPDGNVLPGWMDAGSYAPTIRSLSIQGPKSGAVVWLALRYRRGSNFSAAELKGPITVQTLVSGDVSPNGPTILQQRADIDALADLQASDNVLREQEIERLRTTSNPTPNIIPNSTALLGRNGWIGSASITADPTATDGARFIRTGLGPGSPDAFLSSATDDIKIDGGQPYSMQAELYCFGLTAGSIRAYAVYFDTSGGVVDYQFVTLSAGAAGWTKVVVENRIVPSAAVRAGIRLDSDGGAFASGAILGWRRTKLERGPVATVWTDEASSQDLWSETSIIKTNVLDLEAQNSLARLSLVAASSGGLPARIGLTSSSLGSNIAFDAPYIYFGANTVFDDATDTTTTVWGATQKTMAWGAPFGPDNLVEWTGPSSTPLSSMTKANAGFWVDATGAYGPTPLPSFWAKVTPTQITRSRTGAGAISTALNDVIVTCYTGTSGATCTWSRVSGDTAIAYPSTGFTPVFNTTLAAGQTKTALFVGLVAKGGDVDLVYVNVEFSDNV